MRSNDNPPGAYPVTQRRKIIESKKLATTLTKESTSTKNHKSSLGLNSNVGKAIKSYFQHKEQIIVTKQKTTTISKWKRFWSKKKDHEVIQHQSTSNTVVIGTVFSLSVPVTISTTHYHSKEETTTQSTKYNSIVKQFVILPPLQVYGFLFLATLLLLVIAFALLQVHRTISIIELGVEGIKYVVVGSTLNFLSIISRLKSFWF